jgi:chloramphenicol O-acetyltransferase
MMDLKEEMRREMMEEARRDELHEINMRSDYDDFLEYYSDEVEELKEGYYKLKALHQHFGWEWDIKDIV